MAKYKSITKNSIYNIIYVGMNLLFPLITSAYIARILLPDGVGKVSVAQNLASYFTTFGSLGLPSYGLREISKARSDRNCLSKTFSELLIINIFSSIICSIAYFAVVIGVDGYRENFWLYAACGLPVILNVINVDWFYQGLEEYRYITVRSLAIKAISVVAIFAFVHKKNDYIIYAFIVSLATVGNYIFNIIHSKKIVIISNKSLNIKRHIAPLIRFAIVLLLSSIYSRIDILMLGIISTDQAAGYYTYAQKIINIVLSLCNAATSVLMPRLSLYYKENNKEFINILQKGILVITFVVFPIAVGLYVLSDKVILFLYGDSFIQAAFTVKIFLPLILIKSYGDLLCYQVIIATNNEKQNIIASIIGSTINVILNSLLIPIYQQNGAAIASVAAEFALNLYEIIFTKRTVGYKMPHKDIFQAIFSSLIMGAVIYFINRLIYQPLVSVITCTVIGMFTYFVINYLIKNRFCIIIVDNLRKKISHANK